MSGDQFESIACGLALIGHSPELNRGWRAQAEGGRVTARLRLLDL